MGAWSAAILGNDTSCEVRERFLELYDSGENPSAIAALVLVEQKENLESDRTNVWLGLALACWECKVLTTNTFNEVQNIVAANEDIRFNEELDASADFIKKRQKVLADFITKISKQKEKPRAKKKVPLQVESLYTVGMCLAYKNPAGNYIGIYLTESEHFKNKGAIRFWILDFELDSLPTLQQFEDGKLFGLKELGPTWGARDYMGNITEIDYEKNSKADFYNAVPKLLTIIGKLKACDNDKLANNFRGRSMYLDKPDTIIDALETIRKEWKSKFEVSTITLGQLLDKIELVD